MSPVRLNGSTSGYTELSAPAVAGSNTLLLPTGAGSAYQVVRNGATAGSLEFTDKIVSGTAQNSTSGTSIDFTGIPSWVKRVTVMFNQVSTSGSSHLLIQIGNGSIISSGYPTSTSCVINNAPSPFFISSNSGFILYNGAASNVYNGAMLIMNVTSNTWTAQHTIGGNDTSRFGGGSLALSGTLDRVRITTVNGTDTFDAGSINIMYE